MKYNLIDPADSNKEFKAADPKVIGKVSEMAFELESQKKKPQQRHSDEKKKLVLALCSLSYSLADVAMIAGVAKSTVHCWQNGQHVDGIDYADVALQIKANLSSRLTASASKFLAIANEKAPDANFQQLMVGVGISLEKEALISGKPTHRIEQVTNKIQTIDVSHKKLKEEVRGIESELHDLEENG